MPNPLEIDCHVLNLNTDLICSSLFDKFVNRNASLECLFDALNDGLLLLLVDAEDNPPTAYAALILFFAKIHFEPFFDCVGKDTAVFIIIFVRDTFNVTSIIFFIELNL